MVNSVSIKKLATHPFGEDTSLRIQVCPENGNTLNPTLGMGFEALNPILGMGLDSLGIMLLLLVLIY